MTEQLLERLIAALLAQQVRDDKDMERTRAKLQHDTNLALCGRIVLDYEPAQEEQIAAEVEQARMTRIPPAPRYDDGSVLVTKQLASLRRKQARQFMRLAAEYLTNS